MSSTRVSALFLPPEGSWDVLVAIGHQDAAPPTLEEAVAPTFVWPGWTRVGAARQLRR